MSCCFRWCFRGWWIRTELGKSFFFSTLIILLFYLSNSQLSRKCSRETRCFQEILRWKAKFRRKLAFRNDLGTWDELKASKSGLKKNVQLFFYSTKSLVFVESQRQHENDYTCNEYFFTEGFWEINVWSNKTSWKCVQFINRFNEFTEVNYFSKVVDW